MAYVLPLVLTFLGLNAAAAPPVCQIQGAQDNLQDCIEAPCSTADRMRTVRFPDGREISVIGQDHGLRTNSPKLATRLFLSNAGTGIPDAYLKSIRLNQPAAAQNAANDYVFLRRYLKRQTGPFFIGVETFDANLAPHVQRWSGLKDRIAHWERTEPPPKVTRAKETVMQILNPHLYIYATSPELFKKAYLKGFESQATEMDEERIDQYRADLYEKLILVFKDDPKRLDDMRDTRAAFVLMNETYDPAVDNAKVIEDARSNPDIPEAHRPLIMQWIAAELARLNARLMRDRVTSFNMVNEKRSGVLLVGETHLNAIARLLAEACVREQSGVSPVTPSTYGDTYVSAPVEHPEASR